MKTEIVKFHDTEILALEVDGKLWVAIKPIADSIGLNAVSAVRGIKNDEILGPEHTVWYVQLPEKQSREYVCLPIQHLHGWLFTIQSGKVNQEARERLLIYKKECYKVLFDHFYGKSRLINNSLEERYKLAGYLKKLNKLIHKLMERHKQVKREIEAIDESNYSQLGLFQ